MGKKSGRKKGFVLCEKNIYIYGDEVKNFCSSWQIIKKKIRDLIKNGRLKKKKSSVYLE